MRRAVGPGAAVGELPAAEAAESPAGVLREAAGRRHNRSTQRPGGSPRCTVPVTHDRQRLIARDLTPLNQLPGWSCRANNAEYTLRLRLFPP